MKFYKFICFCFFLLPFNLIANQSLVDSPDECINHPSGINPFFKTDEYNKCYDLPIAPVLNKFDEAVLDICGDWGHIPKKRDFRNLLDKKDYKKYVDEFYEELNHEVFTPNADLTTFKNELAELWFKRHGFTHIMCGQPNRNRLGGMHFFGRYLQAQENQWVGRHYDDKIADEVSDRVFSIPVKFRNSSGELRVNGRKGYDFLHADEIILHATKAYKGLSKDLQSGMRRNQKCLYDADGITYVFVGRKGSIVTFFADLTPSCDRGQTQCSCISDM